MTATSAGSGTAATVEIKTIAINGGDTLIVDNDDNAPNVQSFYADALTANGISFLTWDLKTDANLPLNYTKSFKNVVWFTGNSYPAPITPYEATLKAFLDGGGRLFMSGQDLLDQGAGTTDFVHNYLHITWDGSEAQNDKPTAAVHAIAGTLSDGAGVVPINHAVLGAAFEDQVTPNGTATAIFTDDSGQDDALSYSGTYKVVFLALGLESYGSAAQKADLIHRSFHVLRAVGREDKQTERAASGRPFPLPPQADRGGDMLPAAFEAWERLRCVRDGVGQAAVALRSGNRIRPWGVRHAKDVRHHRRRCCRRGDRSNCARLLTGRHSAPAVRQLEICERPGLGGGQSW